MLGTYVNGVMLVSWNCLPRVPGSPTREHSNQRGFLWLLGSTIQLSESPHLTVSLHGGVIPSIREQGSPKQGNGELDRRRQGRGADFFLKPVEGSWLTAPGPGRAAEAHISVVTCLWQQQRQQQHFYTGRARLLRGLGGGAIVNFTLQNH